MFVFWWCFSCGDSFADAVELKEMKEEQSGHEELVNTATSDWTSRLRHDRNNTSEFPWHVIYLTRFSTNMSEEVKNLTFRYLTVKTSYHQVHGVNNKEDFKIHRLGGKTSKSYPSQEQSD